MAQVNELHIDQALTNFSLEYKNESFVGTKLFPEFPVKKESDKYFVFGRQDFKRYQSKTSPRSKVNYIEYSVAAQPAYVLEEYGLGDFVPQRFIDNADLPLKPEQDAVRKLTNAILLDLEATQASLATNASNYPSGHSESVGTKWSDYTNSNPVTYIGGKRSIIWKATGKAPNTLLVSEDVHEVLKMHPVIRDVIKYTGFGIPAEKTLAQIFEVENYIVARGVYDAEKEGAARDTRYLWNNVAILAYVNPNPTVNDITFGLTFKKADGRKVLKQQLVNPEGVEIIVKDMFDVKIICGYAGYLMVNPIA